MRQSHTGMSLLHDGPQPIGIALGVGRCAEHEQGIDGLAHLLDSHHPDVWGLARFQAAPAQPGSPHIALFERTRHTKTLPAETRLTVHTNPDAVAEIARANKGFSLPVIWAPGGKAPNPLAAAWDMRGFCLRAFGENERAMVRALHHGLMEGQLLLTIGGSANPFSGACLCLTLADRVSQATHDQVLAQQRDHAALLEAAAATGIGARLDAAGLRPRALTPRWTKNLHSVGRKAPDGTRTTHVLATTHPVVFFLTPGWHTTGQSGWYSVEDLDSWIAGTGPVLHG